jgi:hypothetical protein
LEHTIATDERPVESGYTLHILPSTEYAKLPLLSPVIQYNPFQHKVFRSAVKVGLFTPIQLIPSGETAILLVPEPTAIQDVPFHSATLQEPVNIGAAVVVGPRVVVEGVAVVVENEAGLVVDVILVIEIILLFASTVAFKLKY